MGSREKLIVLLLMVILLGFLATASFAANVTYDHRALVIDGKRRILVSGSIHYPRSTPEMWPDLIQKSKDGGLDIIETYVFWNLHEPTQGQYDFSGRKDLVKFVKLVGEAGLYVHLRIGPYVCAEWNYGGFPLWLHFIPGIQFRTDNEPFKVPNAEMQRFTALIVDMMKKNSLYASQGGPIILSQVENEYGNIDSAYGSAAKSYIKWAANMAVSLDTGVPWVMCQQPDAPDPIYHGGTNFDRSSGGPFITTTYDYDAPIDEYGIVRQPKWGHLKDVHNAIKLCESAMMATDPSYTFPGPNLEVATYKTDSGLCAAFLANVDPQSDKTISFNGNSYQMPAWSVSILPDCKNVVLNTAKINSVSTLPKFVRRTLKYNVDTSGGLQLAWSSFIEPVGMSKSSAFVKHGLLEQINTTADKSDYLWYSISTVMKGDEPFLQNGSQPVLHVESLGHGLYAFINGKLAGNKIFTASARARLLVILVFFDDLFITLLHSRATAASKFAVSGNHKISVDIPVMLQTSSNTIDLLSLTVGLQNYGAFFDTWGAGVTGPVLLKSSGKGQSVDLSSQLWTYQVCLCLNCCLLLITVKGWSILILK
ncbi:hypothetical protein Cgig2_015658 [Carnegiea gigantea]|uniref:Beta-galactosidase n=1 Tax=Carnegiea gigantea TaxID=171969 RepID=A0A9Q1JX81_9CARY|nr:hypothetical protein Cgig2_015658 [Carnegiea gigantea]